MAFRELYSNTLDEQGDTLELNEQQTGEWNEKHPNRWGMVETGKETLIAVTKCPEFVEAFRSRSAIFLSLDDHPVISKLGGVEIREGVTERLFYQGMRAKDVGKPAMFTYNFTVGQVLTEDRQLAHEHQVRTVLANNIAKADDEAVIEKIVTADQEQWEHGLEPSSWIEPSRAFHNVMIRVKSKATGAWGGYFRSHDDRPEVKKKDLWEDAPRPWKVDGGDILDNEGKPLFSMPFNMNNLVWATLAERLVRVSNSWKPPKSKGRAALAADFGLEPEYTLLYNPIATAEVLSEGEDDTPF